MQSDEDTIVALSTPWGVGAIALVRLSGRDAVTVVDGVFVGRTSLRDLPSHVQTYGRIVASGGGPQVAIDEVMVTVHRAPHSYTGEDVVEVTCHGGPLIVRELLQLFCDRGARMAEPGEFTKRAFLHGRIDLAQAEAVCDLITARTERARQCAMAQVEGRLSRRITDIQKSLAEVRTLLELDIDFVEDDVPQLDKAEVAELLTRARKDADALLATFSEGRLLREGARVVLVGRTNVGKSSLLNALLESDRAIVSEQPGTTRDTVEGLIDVAGIPVTLVDTAGLGGAESAIEQEAVRRTEREVQRADVIALVFDGSAPLTEGDQKLLQRFATHTGHPPRVIPVINKIDLPRAWEREAVRFNGIKVDPVELSAKEGLGLEHLRQVLTEVLAGDGVGGAAEVVVTNLRHRQALHRAILAMDRARQSLDKGLSAEFVAVDVREASEALGEIVGVVTDEDILTGIFARFCIGK